MIHKLNSKQRRFRRILDKFVEFLEMSEPMTTKELINEWCDWWEEHREHIKTTKSQTLKGAYHHLPHAQTLGNRIGSDLRFVNVSPVFWDETKQRHRTSTARWVLKDSQLAEERVVDNE